MSQLNSKQVERLGAFELEKLCINEGLDIASPSIDNGIDYLIYSSDSKFIPVQLKVSIGERFSVFEKYNKFPNIHQIYVCNVNNPEKIKIYILSQNQALKIAEDMGWNWSGQWTTPKLSQKLTNLLEPYLYKPDMLTKIIRQETILV